MGRPGFPSGINTMVSQGWDGAELHIVGIINVLVGKEFSKIEISFALTFTLKNFKSS